MHLQVSLMVEGVNRVVNSVEDTICKDKALVVTKQEAGWIRQLVGFLKGNLLSSYHLIYLD